MIGLSAFLKQDNACSGIGCRNSSASAGPSKADNDNIGFPIPRIFQSSARLSQRTAVRASHHAQGSCTESGTDGRNACSLQKITP